MAGTSENNILNAHKHSKLVSFANILLETQTHGERVAYTHPPFQIPEPTNTTCRIHIIYTKLTFVTIIYIFFIPHFM